MIPGVEPITLLGAYGPVVAGAFVSAWIWMRVQSSRRSLPDLGTPFVLTAIAGVLGARAFFLSQAGTLSAAGLFSFQPGGMSVAGGLAVGLPVSALLIRWWPIEGTRPSYLWWRWMDCAAQAFAVGLIIERLGAFVAGIDFGRYVAPTEWGAMFGVRYPGGSPVHRFQEVQLVGIPGLTSELSATVHPVQLYSVAAGVAMLLLARWLRPRVQTHGMVMLALMGVFISVQLVIVEGLRHGASEIVWGPLHLHQIGGLGLLLALILVARQLARTQVDGRSE